MACGRSVSKVEMVANQQPPRYDKRMTYLYEILQIELENAVLYRVSKATRICVSQLSRIRRGRRCNLVIAGILLAYFGYEIKKKMSTSNVAIDCK